MKLYNIPVLAKYICKAFKTPYSVAFSMLSWYAATFLSPFNNNNAYITFVAVVDRCSETMATEQKGSCERKRLSTFPTNWLTYVMVENVLQQ